MFEELTRAFQALERSQMLMQKNVGINVALNLTGMCLRHGKRPREVVELFNEVLRELKREFGGDRNDGYAPHTA